MFSTERWQRLRSFAPPTHSEQDLVGGDGQGLLANHKVASEGVERVVGLLALHHGCQAGTRTGRQVGQTEPNEP